MEINLMYRPEITDKQCEKLSKDLGILICNRNYDGKRWPIIKSGGKVLDSSFSFAKQDPRVKDIATKLKGNVLILGLGFGKAVLYTCENSQVKSVTVVEKNEGVIDLFALINKEMKGKSKLSIIHKDALEYETKKKFDHVFIDIYHDVTNMIEYTLTIDKLSETFKKSTIHQIPL